MAAHRAQRGPHSRPQINVGGAVSDLSAVEPCLQEIEPRVDDVAGGEALGLFRSGNPHPPCNLPGSASPSGLGSGRSRDTADCASRSRCAGQQHRTRSRGTARLRRASILCDPGRPRRVYRDRLCRCRGIDHDDAWRAGRHSSGICGRDGRAAPRILAHDRLHGRSPLALSASNSGAAHGNAQTGARCSADAR